VGVYVHIPFCVSHCTYCGFYSELLPCRQGSETVVDEFVRALCREISLERPDSGGTVYFGGGTPSVLSLSQLEAVVDALAPGIDSEVEMTIEVNPDDIVRKGEDYAVGLRKLGFNRVSMGVQSLDDVLLRRMGRRHTGAEAVRAFAMLRSAGFENISVDFIFGFSPGAVPIGDFLARMGGSLSDGAGFPEHVSCYQLSIEQGSGLEKMVSKGLYSMPSDEDCALQYASVCDTLRAFGYEHYEISNWARRPALRSRHNSSYWNHTPYLGFGPGAHSLIGNSRRWNNTDLKAYLSAAKSGDFSCVQGSEILSEQQWNEERVMLGLRTCEGIPQSWIPEESLCKALSAGSLERCDAFVRIPESKWFVSDDIILSL